VVPVLGTSLRQEIEDLLIRAGLRLPANRIEGTSFLTVRRILLETDAIGFRSALVAAEDERLKALPHTLISLRSVVGITTVAGRTLGPTSYELIRHMRGAVLDTERSLRRQDQG